MRPFLILVAILAGAKVWTQDRWYRSIMQDALVQAYGEKAANTCLKEAQRGGKQAAAVWNASTGAEVVIGNSATDVAIWDYQNPLWDVRFRHPHVLLTQPGSKAHCAFDVAAGLARIGVN